jgi:folylpolyglutamate synthase/dihydropteroate synthase
MNDDKVLAEPLLGIPQQRRMIGAPLVMTFDRLPVAGQIQAGAAFPARAESQSDSRLTGGPMRMREQTIIPDIPRLRRHGRARVVRAVKPKSVLDAAHNQSSAG